MITFKVVNFVVGEILILILLCESCLSIDVTQNVHFIKRSSENHNQEQEQNVISPKILSLNNKWVYKNTLSDTINNEEITSAEDRIRRKDEKRSLILLRNKERIVRQVSNGYSALYPALPTPYPNVNVNSASYRPTAPLYEPMPYNSFNNYPVSNQNYFSNTTARYPPYNPISSRPPYYPPTQNLNYGNSSPFSQNLNQYNRSSYLNPNNFSPQTAQHKSFNNFTVSNQNYFPNTTVRYPPYNPASSRPPYYSPQQNFNYSNSPHFNQNLNPYNRSSYLNSNYVSSQTGHNTNFNNFPVSNQNYITNTTVRYPPYNPISSRPQYYPSKQNLNYTNSPSFNQNPSRYNQSSSSYYNNFSSQNIPTYQQNTPNYYSKYNTSMNMLYTSTKAPWSNRNLSNTSGYGYNSYQHNTQQTSAFYPGNGFTSSGSQSRWPGTVNNGTYTNQSPYFSSTLKPAFYDGSKYNIPPNQNNYIEPNHFFYTPGQNPSTYDTSKLSPQRFY